jgi:hypothetical protein
MLEPVRGRGTRRLAGAVVGDDDDDDASAQAVNAVLGCASVGDTGAKNTPTQQIANFSDSLYARHDQGTRTIRDVHAPAPAPAHGMDEVLYE